MNLSLNGRFSNDMWRVDDLDEQRVGIDFLQHPHAIFNKLEDAKHYIELVKKEVEDDY